MLRIKLAAVASLAILITSPAFAATAAVPAPPASTVYVNAQQAKHDLAPLAEVFDVKSGESTAPADTSTNETASVEHKSMGDVADRALTMVDNVTGKIAESLQKIAPQVWRIMIKQQIMKAVTEPLGPLGWIVGMLVLSHFGLKVWKSQDGQESEEDGTMTDVGWENFWRMMVLKALPTCVCVLATLFFFGALKYSILHAGNPEYYAIQDLLKSIMTATPPA